MMACIGFQVCYPGMKVCIKPMLIRIPYITLIISPGVLCTRNAPLSKRTACSGTKFWCCSITLSQRDRSAVTCCGKKFFNSRIQTHEFSCMLHRMNTYDAFEIYVQSKQKRFVKLCSLFAIYYVPPRGDFTLSKVIY